MFEAFLNRVQFQLNYETFSPLIRPRKLARLAEQAVAERWTGLRIYHERRLTFARLRRERANRYKRLLLELRELHSSNDSTDAFVQAFRAEFHRCRDRTIKSSIQREANKWRMIGTAILGPKISFRSFREISPMLRSSD